VSADVDERPAGGADNADTADTAETAEVRPRGVRRFWPLAVLVIALVVAVAGVLSWSRAAHDDSIALAKTRDAVLIAATSHIETLNTLDYRHVDAGLATWAAVTTGTLHDQVTQVSSDERKLLADQKKISTGKVVDAAVFSLDGDSATVVASVEVTVQDDTQASAAPTVKRNRFSADLVDVHGKWLVENLQQVAVNIS
jgi:Mce-associated membrane protein